MAQMDSSPISLLVDFLLWIKTADSEKEKRLLFYTLTVFTHKQIQLEIMITALDRLGLRPFFFNDPS